MSKKKNSRSAPVRPDRADRKESLGVLDIGTFESMDVGAFMVDTELRLVWANAEFIRMLGDSKGETGTIIGRPIIELLPDLPEDILDEYRNVLKPNRPNFRLEIPLSINQRRYTTEFRISPLSRDNKVTHALTTIWDITDRVDRVAFETMMANLSARFINMPIERIDQGIELGLKNIVDILDVDRAVIFRISEGDEIRASHLWDESSLKPFPRIFESSRFPWFMAKIANKEMVVIESIDDLPPEAVGERQYFKKMGIKSQMIIPLQVGGSVMGGLSIGAYREHKVWSGDFIQRFRLIGEVFASAIMRREGQSALKQALEEVSHYRAIVNRSPAIVIRWGRSPEGPVDFISENIRQFGYSPEDFQSGRLGWEDITLPGELRAIKAEASKFVQSGVLEFVQRYRLRTQSGEIRWIEDMSKCIQDKSGVINHVEGILLDITERKAIEEALKASEQRYRLLVENVNAHISVSDATGKFLFINGLGARAHARVPEDIIGRHLGDLFPPSVVENQMRAIKAVIVTGEEKNDRMEVKIGDEWRWFDVNLQPYRESEESGAAVMIIATDITERLKADEALRSREEQYRMLIDNVQADIVLVDYDGVFLFVNGSSARNFGRSPEEIIGRRQQDLFPPESANRQLRNIREVIKSGREFQEEVDITIGGKRRWLDINIQPYRDHDGQVTSAMIIAIDITNRKEAERALVESEERFRLQFTSLPIAAYIWEYTSDDFVLTDFNLAAVEITRGGIERFIGNKLSEMYGDAPEIIEDMLRCFKEKAAITREMPYYMISTGENKYLRLFYVYVPPNLVVAHTEDITESYHAREALQQAHDDLDIRVRQRTSELADANEALQVEREALQQKNIALREVLDQIEAGKRQLASQIQSNINRIVLPILKSLESKTAPAGRHYTELLRTSLDDIASPLISTLETKFARLTPRELEVCNMVRNGLSSKDIAGIFHTSVQTVLKQRTIIRKKLGLTSSQTNLASYLKSLE